MLLPRLLGLLSAGVLLLSSPQASSAGQNGETRTETSPLFRIFLKDGSSLVSYGELARLEDRVVFSMPTSASEDQPQLHLVTLSPDRVDWERTTRYADSARATRYRALRAEQDYALLTDEVAQALDEVSKVQDPAARLKIVERARKTLADWPPAHYDYKQQEISQMLGTLDEAIADLRASIGLSRFNLSFVAATESVLRPREPLLPPPTPREAIEQTLLAARHTTSSVERVSLLTTALAGLNREVSGIDATWATSTRVSTQAMMESELAVDRAYQGLTRRYLTQAEQRARLADVRGVRTLLDRIGADDRSLGRRRPEAVESLIAAVEQQLDAARRLRLARDQWLLRSDDYKKYAAAVEPHLGRLESLKSALEDIKSLAGSTPAALSLIQSAAAQVLKSAAALLPPEELRPAHALLVSAAQMADTAARIRREAALSGDLARAWDASSAAAGSLMLSARARSDIQALLRSPLPTK